MSQAGRNWQLCSIYDLVKEVTGSAFYPSIADSYLDSGGLPFIRVADLSEFFIRQDSLTYVPKSVVDAIPQIVTVQEGDIVLAKGGTIGGASLVQSGLGTCATSRDVIAIRTDPNKIDSSYLVAFLLSGAGQLQFERHKSQQVQAHLTFPAVGNMRVIVPEREEQAKVSGRVHEAWQKKTESQKYHAQAQALLGAELGLDKLDLSESVYSVRRASEVREAGRADAEYFRPKYKRLLEHLNKTGQSVRLGDWVVEPIKRGVQPDYADDGPVVVVNSQHVGKTHITFDNNRFTTREFYQTSLNRRALIRRGDVLLNSTGYITIGRSQTVLEEVEALVDGHVAIIRPKEGIDPVYLGLYLNALPGQLQTERGWTGSSGQIELRTDVIAEYVVWRPAMRLQLRIREMIEQAHSARRESQRLLAEAKAEVERMIEGR